jgi:hypothetical protein
MRRLLCIVVAALGLVFGSPVGAQTIPSGHLLGNGTSATRAPTDTTIFGILNNSGAPCQIQNALLQKGVSAWGCTAPINLGAIPNGNLLNSSITVNGVQCTLGGSCAPTAAGASVTVGTTSVVGAGANAALFNNGGLLGSVTTANNAVYSTGAGGAPAISTTLPSGLTIPSPTVTGALTNTGNALISGTSAPSLSNGNAAFYASATAGGIYSGQGSVSDFSFFNKSGQVVANNPTGTQTLNINTLTLTNTLSATYLPTGSTSALGLMKCDGTTITCTSGNLVAIGAAATSVAITTTTISGGTNGDVLTVAGGALAQQAYPVTHLKNATFTTDATSTTTTVYRYRCVGGGGGGGGSGATGTGGGGGAGAYMEGIFSGVAAGATVTVSLGTGGTGGAAGGVTTNGTAGGNTTISATGMTTVTANGGAGGNSGNASAGSGGVGGVIGAGSPLYSQAGSIGANGYFSGGFGGLGGGTVFGPGGMPGTAASYANGQIPTAAGAGGGGAVGGGGGGAGAAGACLIGYTL